MRRTPNGPRIDKRRCPHPARSATRKGDPASCPRRYGPKASPLPVEPGATSLPETSGPAPAAVGCTVGHGRSRWRRVSGLGRLPERADPGSALCPVRRRRPCNSNAAPQPRSTNSTPRSKPLRAEHRHHRRLPLLRRAGRHADWRRAACAPTPAPPTTAGAKPSTSAAAAASTPEPGRRSTGSPPTPAATAGTTPPGHKPAAPNPNPGIGNTVKFHQLRRIRRNQ